ncbi:hypothetical protein HD806DRAFT_537670 [Xylariaceae sp. AK1471]|nr:hypothetical protein HD806DRAFT_537670 [Xylariaceae sp. AK1471]
MTDSGTSPISSPIISQINTHNLSESDYERMLSTVERYVPEETIQVARYDQMIYEHPQKPEAKAWIIKSKRDPNKSFALRLLPEIHAEVRLQYPVIPEIENMYWKGAFLKGRPLKDLAIHINTCGSVMNRPMELYRLTHEGQPHEGKKPRGHGLVETDPLSYHIFMLKHLEWRCRNPSPFLSVTPSYRKVMHMYELYKRRGYQGIKLIEFRSYGPEWDHEKQRLFHVPSLGYAFDDIRLQRQPFFRDEYLLEGGIPPESIINEVSLPSFSRPNIPKTQREVPAEKRKRPTDAEDEEGEEDDEDEGQKKRRKFATQFKLRI